MPRKPQKGGEGLADVLAKAPNSSRWMQQHPFEHQLSEDQLIEWETVRADYQKGKFSHISITALKKYVLQHFGMRSMSFDKFKAELEGRRSAKSHD